MLFQDLNDKKVILDDERWIHINERHPEFIDNIMFIEQTIADPDYIQEGNKNEILTIKKFGKTPITFNKYCIVVYKFDNSDGFIITAYFTRRPSFRRKTIWKK